ncbi:fructose-6-phosphate aldolase [Vagococcus luciliae]|uniref:Fructose-6-phosphate aldolase 1 n=1 Tax=Vagococcus luciliae TaxID=2920380 RepID=A0ABY5NYC7_9ENTE|nr:fructose-6-phosphate aldolase [Vagococcus luciliae]UUV98654.1 Fructose-6-phosphate aldolase 1 [Vagococcus luciliae]
MEFLLDTINLETIRLYNDCLEIDGVTSNPSIVKKEGRVDFYQHMKDIRQVIGFDKTLHVQVIGKTYEEMMTDAKALISEIDSDIYIKVPTTLDGLKVMKELKKMEIGVTATAIYSTFQGIMAINVGADYIAPYYNRMENLGVQSSEVLLELSEVIKTSQSSTKILAASFKNVLQVNSAISAGAHAVTIGPDILDNGLNLVSVDQAVEDFRDDWFSLYDKYSIE